MKEQNNQINVGSEAARASRNIGPASMADILGCHPAMAEEQNEGYRRQRRKIFDGIREGSTAMACVSVIAGASVTFDALHR